jgi:hypothetical protein
MSSCRYLRSFFVLSVLLLGLSACATGKVLQGELSGELYWQGEVYLQGNVVIEKGARLTIAPGTRVVFLPSNLPDDELNEHPYFPGTELIVRGEIIALGTKAQPIFFQAEEKTAEAGSWGAVNIEGSARAIFDYCVFQQADSALHARDSWVVVENSKFINNLVGIRFHDTNILIEKNLLEKNGAAIRFHFGAPVICKNIIRDNGKGLFITSEPREYTIENNSFIANRPYQVSLGEGVRQAVVLRNNFWGAQTEQSLPESLYDGRVDEWLGRVEFLPMRQAPDPDSGGVWK